MIEEWSRDEILAVSERSFAIALANDEIVLIAEKEGDRR
jgi:hypothetical protein